MPEAIDIAFGKAAKQARTPAVYISERVGGKHRIWRSLADAASWQMLAMRPLSRLDGLGTVAADPDRFGRIYLSYQGSGWIYGEPALCAPASSDRDAVTQCVAVEQP